MVSISILGLADVQYEALVRQQAEILKKQEQLMAKLTDVSAAIDRMKQAIVKEIQEVKDKIAGGGAATAADLDGVVAALDKATAEIDTISEGGVTPTPAPEP